jgi:hypothetical protein
MAAVCFPVGASRRPNEKATKAVRPIIVMTAPSACRAFKTDTTAYDKVFSPGSGLLKIKFLAAPIRAASRPRVRGGGRIFGSSMAVKRDAGPSHPIDSGIAGLRTCENNALLWQPRLCTLILSPAAGPAVRKNSRVRPS